MNAARRNARRRDWPRGLYEKRPGYYTWRNPLTGKELTLGFVDFQYARNEAMLANRHIAQNHAPSLVAILKGETHTIAELAKRMPVSEKKNTASSYRSQDHHITAELGALLCKDLSVKHCADFLQTFIDADKGRTAQAVRSRLIVVCRKGMALGWMERNVAEATEKKAAPVRRGRLSLEQFLKIRAAAEHWLPFAMNLALVTGQDRSTLAFAQRTDVTRHRAAPADDLLTLQRVKTQDTNAPVAIPLDIRLDALGLSLRDVLAQRAPVVSPHLICHTRQHADTYPGDPLHPDTISKAFTEARQRAKIPDVSADGHTAPTFHEIRSLAKRLYDEQGNVDTKALLGHKSDQAAAIYADARDIVQPIRVRIAK
jgi:integrase